MTRVGAAAPAITRRGSLAALVGGLAGSLGLAGCANRGSGEAVVVLDAASGRPLTPDEVIAGLRASELLLLGEQHDNPEHHRVRGGWLARLAGSIVVAEHLPRGQRVQWQPRALSPSLEASGFEPQAWRWPLHEPLFAPLMAQDRPLWGGNAPREEVRAVARGAESSLSGDARQALAGAELSAEAQAGLDAELQQGHCGQLPAARLPGMRLAQRLRDAAMGQTLLDAWAAGARPAVLVAGNGHVRKDWGVAAWLARRAPQRRVLSVGFGEGLADGRLPPVAPAPYDWWCVTAAVPGRGDPCEGLRMPRG